MTLEDLILKLIGTIEANTAAIQSDAALREAAVEAIRANTATAPKSTTKATTKPADPAPETKAADTVQPQPETKRADPAPETKTEDRVSAAQAEEMKGKVGAYMDIDRIEEREARRVKVRALLQHDAIKVPGTAADVYDTKNVKASAFDVFMKNINTLIARGDIIPAPAASENLV